MHCFLEVQEYQGQKVVSMLFEERKSLRLSLLKELYDYYFENNGMEMPFMIDEANDKERELAYQYLIDKNLVLLRLLRGSMYGYKITAQGIDVIESVKNIN